MRTQRPALLVTMLLLAGFGLLITWVGVSVLPRSAAATGLRSRPLLDPNSGSSASVWVYVSSPSIGSGNNYLEDVTLDPAGGVWAVGSTGANGLILHSTDNGQTWQTYTTTVGTANIIMGVTALAANDVFAVGAYTSTTLGQQTFALHYTGTWNVVPSASPGSQELESPLVSSTLTVVPTSVAIPQPTSTPWYNNIPEPKRTVFAGMDARLEAAATETALTPLPTPAPPPVWTPLPGWPPGDPYHAAGSGYIIENGQAPFPAMEFLGQNS